ncbi:MAG: pyridoxamine 5'-phosphate oxidase family protein [Lachnospiraceae bacterium]|nr:pyridoxamine 5'-phosphate oxidase family protein [Lachnospiraceae bacterium]
MRRKDREITDMQEIAKILDACKTASIAMIDEGTPYVVPLSYGYELSDNQLVLYFHSAKEGRKIGVLKNNNQVCFTVFDEGEPLHAEIPCNSGYYYSSIIGNGTVEFIEQAEEKTYALGKMFAHQSGRKVVFTEEQAATVCVFKVISTDFTGKRKPK